jgi:hypothetical protein
MAIVLSSVTGLQAAELYVATTGDNGNPGTVEQPLRTIQAAADRMNPGDVCLIREGTYREVVKIERSGQPDRPLRFEAYQNEQVVVDGTETVTGRWQPYKGSIYRIGATKGIKQLFVGREMMIEARWPNMRFDQRFDRDCWAKVDMGSTHGRIVCDALAQTGLDCTGAMACLNVAHQWWTWNRPITTHKAGSNVLEYPANLVGLCNYDPAINKDKEYLAKAWGDDYFYLFGKLEFLDSETEWFQDPQSGDLYLFAPGGVDPTTLEVRYKLRDYSLLAQSRHDVQIRKLKFFATTFRLDDCDRCLVEGCELLYPSFSRTITEYDERRSESVFTKVVGNHNTIRRCALAYTNNLGLMVMGSENTVDDCIIHDVNWYGTLIYPALQLSASPHLGVNWFDTIQYPPTARTIDNSDITSRGNVASRNTLFNGGSSLLVYQAADTVIEYNHVHNGGRACKDVSLIYGCWPFSRGSIVRYNWVHGCVTDGYSGRGGSGGIGIRADDQSRNNSIHHNVVWDCGQIGIVVKGEDHRIFNNTVFNIGTANDPQFDIMAETGAEPIKIWAVQWPQLLRQNQWTLVVNNLCRHLTFSHKITDNLSDSDRVHHNLRGLDIAVLLQDAAGLDFRPAAGSPLIEGGVVLPGFTDGFKGKAPDLGAYETGGEEWVAGASWTESFTKQKERKK